MIDERALWAGVIRRALYDLAQADEQSPKIKRAAQRWLESPDTGPGSFNWICLSFNAEPSFLRRKLLQRAAELRQAAIRPRCTRAA